MSYLIEYLDTCTPDYFRGSHKEVIQIAIDKNSNYQQIKEGFFEYYNTEHLNENIDTSGLEYKNAVDTLFDGIKNMAAIPSNTEGLDYSFDEMDDNMECCYMFFSIESIDDDE